MKYTLMFFVAMLAIAESKIYVGTKTTFSYSRNSMLTNGINESCLEPVRDANRDYIFDQNGDFVMEPKDYPLSGDFLRMDKRSANFGFLVGYSFENLHRVYKPYVELDLDLIAKTYQQNGIDYDIKSKENALNNESFKVRSSAVLGLTLGVDAAVTESISAIVGARFTLTNYTATATHTGNVESLLPTNSLTRKAYLFGFEPMVGAKYKFNDNMAVRFTVGYNFGQTKNIINNYITNIPNNVHKDTSAGLTLKPRSLNFTVALIYTF